MILSSAKILDTRPTPDFLSAHLPNAANVPLEELPDRIYELPPRHESISLFDTDPDRASRAVTLLANHQRDAATITAESHELIESGPATNRLWRPHVLLVEALQFARQQWPDFATRTALDLGCGSGRDAVYLAEKGFNTHAWDILPDALAQCEALACRNNVHVTTCCIDLEGWHFQAHLGSGIPPHADDHSTADSIQNSFDLICCFNFLHRPLLTTIRDLLTPKGLLVYETFVDPQRELFGKPHRPQFILRKNELREAFADFEILVYREHLAAPHKHAASLIARSIPH